MDPNSLFSHVLKHPGMEFRVTLIDTGREKGQYHLLASGETLSMRGPLNMPKHKVDRKYFVGVFHPHVFTAPEAVPTMTLGVTEERATPRVSLADLPDLPVLNHS